MTGERRFDPGDTVRVVKGGYRGFTGVVSGYDADTERPLIVIAVFGRESRIAADPEDVESVGPK